MWFPDEAERLVALGEQIGRWLERRHHSHEG
jgi:hypothetical protein